MQSNRKKKSSRKSRNLVSRSVTKSQSDSGKKSAKK